jgi:acyl-CoA synthetase (AMP-forming)/AMP-acid ligase II
MLTGLMMNRPLSISSIIDYAAEVHGNAEIVSANAHGEVSRRTYAATLPRIARLAHALRAMGIKPGDRVATLAFNSARHFELYYAISGIGAVCHTINPRLFPDQLEYIVRHAGDRILFFGGVVADLVRKMRPQWPVDLQYVAMEDAKATAAIDGIPGLLAYEDLLAGQPDTITWPQFDENAACGLCYTSGTTGEPKGVLYSHRSTLLHAFGTALATSKLHGMGKRLLPIVPLFHVNAWGMPYTAPLTGTSIVMPGPRLDGASLFDLMDSEGVTGSLGVPTVWRGLITEIQKRGRKPKALGLAIIGGSACPRSMIEELERLGIEVNHAWGMTEMSPVGSCGELSPDQEDLPAAERFGLKETQGRRMFGVDMKIVDDGGCRMPHDGKEIGELLVRGPAVAAAYFDNPGASSKLIDTEGWMRTGDMARIYPNGFMQIVDRSKDLIKSGGEWISSVDLENLATGYPGVAMAAVIGVPDPKWDERPLLVVQAAHGASIDKAGILAFMASKLAKWQVPDEVLLVEALPLTATGKISKLQLRETVARMRGA